MKRPSTIVLALVAMSGAAGAETAVPSGNYATATWTEAGSPYRVMGDVSFDESLVIEAGTEVLVALADPLVHIRVGRLTVNGRPDSPVTFKAETPGEDQGWWGLRVGPDSELNFARLHDTALALDVSPGSGETATVVGSVFDNAQHGIDSSGGTLHVDRSVFSGVIGITASSGSRVFVDNSVFVDTVLEGVRCSGTCSVRNSTFNGGHVGVSSSAGNVDVQSCIFTNNEHALQNRNGTVAVSHSAFWANFADFDGEVTQGEANLFTNPRYLAPDDYHLSSDSPCIDTGADDGPSHDFDGRVRPVVVLNGVGQGFDMGAHEFNPAGDGGTGGDASGGVGGEAGEGVGGVGAVGGDNGASGGSLGGGNGGASSGAGGVGGAATASGAGGNSPGDTTGGAAPGGTGATSGSGMDDDVQTSKGCGCRQPGAPSGSPAYLLVLLGAAVAAGRRRLRSSNSTL